MKTNQLPPLPTPKFTETIRGVPCITVTEHEHLIRAYAQQAIAKATQTADVTDAAIDSAIYNQCPDFDDWYEGPSIDDIRAIVRAAMIAAKEGTNGEIN